MGAFFQAIAFLTRLPVPARPFSEKDWQKSVAYYPFVGALLGLILWLAAYLLPLVFSDWLSAILLLTLWVFLTGGLHLDGWMDVADGLGSHRSRERILEIMKDSRVGAMGVLAAILLLLVKMVSMGDLIQGNSPLWFLLPPWIARLVLLCAMRFWPYISKDGLASGLGKGIHIFTLLFHALLLIGFVWWIGKSSGLLIVVLSLVLGLGWTHRVYRKLGGLTGDVYGATVEWTEMVVLLLILVAWRLG